MAVCSVGKDRKIAGEVIVEAVLQEPTVGDVVADAFIGDDVGEGVSLQEVVKLLIDPRG